MDDDQSLWHESDRADAPGNGNRHGVQGAREQAATYGRVLGGPWHADGQTTASSLAERIVETTSVALVVLDVELRVRSANPAFYDLFQVAPAETEGHEFLALGDGQWDVPWLRESLGQLLDLDGRLHNAEIEMDAPRIGRRMVQISARRLVGLDAPEQILLTIEDLTERKAAEQARRDVGLLLAHELRNPLTTIMGHAQLMQRRAAKDQSTLGVIVAQAKQMNRLIDDLLDGSTRGSDELHLETHPMDLTELARSSAEQAQVLLDAKHTVRLELPSGPINGCWDEGRLAQVFANLIGNAVKYSPDGGEIVVQVADLGTMARVSIQDQGVGIEPSELPYIFDKFYRSPAHVQQANGLGLGLHVVRTLVEAHGGLIDVESMPGLGSTFSFTLPQTAHVPARNGLARS